MTKRTATNGLPGQAVLVKERFAGRLPGRLTRTLEHARDADAILEEFGEVGDNVTYARRHQARHRARRLIEVLVETGRRRRPDLCGHVYAIDDGWAWCVERLDSVIPEAPTIQG